MSLPLPSGPVPCWRGRWCTGSETTWPRPSEPPVRLGRWRSTRASDAELAESSELLGLVRFAKARSGEVFAEGFLDTVERSPDLAPFVYDVNLCMSEFALHQPDGLADLNAFADELLERAGQDSRPARAVSLLLRGEVGLLGIRDPVQWRQT